MRLAYGIGTSLLIYISVVATAFPVLYASRSNWRVSVVGRSMMTFVIVIAVVLDFSAITVILGAANPNPPPWRAWSRLVVFTPIAYALTRQLVVLWRVQRDPDEVRRRDAIRALHRSKVRAGEEN